MEVQVIATKKQLQNVGIDYNINRQKGELLKSYGTGYHKVRITYKAGRRTFTNSFDIPGEYLRKVKTVYPCGLDAAKELGKFSHFSVRKGKAKYHLLHVPDKTVGIYYAFRISQSGLCAKRAIDPLDELTVVFNDR